MSSRHSCGGLCNSGAVRGTDTVTQKEEEYRAQIIRVFGYQRVVMSKVSTAGSCADRVMAARVREVGHGRTTSADAGLAGDKKKRGHCKIHLVKLTTTQQLYNKLLYFINLI